MLLIFLVQLRVKYGEFGITLQKMMFFMAEEARIKNHEAFLLE